MAVADPTAGGNPEPLDRAAANRLLAEAYSGVGI